jgi:hypothetical protein
MPRVGARTGVMMIGGLIVRRPGNYSAEVMMDTQLDVATYSRSDPNSIRNVQCTNNFSFLVWIHLYILYKLMYRMIVRGI